MKGTAEERLARQTLRQEEGRWLWQGNVFSDGYGAICFQNKVQRVPRLAFRAATGVDPVGLLVMHTCDTPLCVRPDHLRLGTPADNMADKVQKGRHRWNNLPGRKQKRLTSEEVFKLKADIAAGVTVRDAAERYGVSRSNASAILNGRSRANG